MHQILQRKCHKWIAYGRRALMKTNVICYRLSEIKNLNVVVVWCLDIWMISKLLCKCNTDLRKPWTTYNKKNYIYISPSHKPTCNLEFHKSSLKTWQQPTNKKIDLDRKQQLHLHSWAASIYLNLTCDILYLTRNQNHR